MMKSDSWHIHNINQPYAYYILQSLASTEDEGLTLTEILQIQVPKSTIAPIIHTLRDHKFIEQKRWRYILGINMF